MHARSRIDELIVSGFLLRNLINVSPFLFYKNEPAIAGRLSKYILVESCR
jgi:hypothetical protein